MDVTSDWADSELIAGSSAEPAMFSEIFDRHHGELYRYLRRRVGAGPAADLAAETFVTAFGRRGTYRPQTADARPWRSRSPPP
jgi:RNA polymerase sigma-70 factor (ECF subfamily)